MRVVGLNSAASSSAVVFILAGTLGGVAQALPAQAILPRHWQHGGFCRAPALPGLRAGKFGSASGTGQPADGLAAAF
jgi:hypothetical protein